MRMRAWAHVSSSQGSIIYRIRDGQHARTGGGRSPSRDEGLWRIHISGNAFRSATVVCLANASQNSPLKRVQYGTLQRLTQTMQDQPCDAESHPQVRRAKPNACSNVRVEQRLTVTVVALSASHAGGPDSAFVVVQVHTIHIPTLSSACRTANKELGCARPYSIPRDDDCF